MPDTKRTTEEFEKGTAKLAQMLQGLLEKAGGKLIPFLSEQGRAVLSILSIFLLVLCGMFAFIVPGIIPLLTAKIDKPPTHAAPAEVAVSGVQGEVANTALPPTATPKPTKRPTVSAPTFPPEGTWLVTPEDGASCDSSIVPQITSPFTVSVSYDPDESMLVINQPEGVLAVEKVEDSPVTYTGGDGIAEYELIYNQNNDGTMSVTEKFVLAGAECVVLYGTMEYQGQ